MWKQTWNVTGSSSSGTESSRLLLNIDVGDQGSCCTSSMRLNADGTSSAYGSIVRLSPGRCPSEEDALDDGKGAAPWWKRKAQRIFRRKTLYMRIPVLQWLPKYSRKEFVPDLLAGITVGITVIPQGLAYATLAGLPPQYGLYSAYMGCFIYFLLGSTKAVTMGPTALMSLVTYEGASLMGPDAAIFLAFVTGCICLLIGLLNFGFLIEFIAAPVIAGFTTAAAVTIATTQVKSLLGLTFDAEGFVNTWKGIIEHIDETRLWDTVLGFSCIVALLLLRLLDRVQLGKNEESRTKAQRAFNGTMWFISISRNAIILLFATILASILCEPDDRNNPFILTGKITSGLPPPRVPPFSAEYNNQTFTLSEMTSNLGSALFVSPLVAILEHVSIAKSFARGQKVDASQEMIAIGASNLVGSFFSAYPITGSFSRTAVNNSSGVKTPFGGLYTGALVLLAITVLTPYFYFIPKTSLAAVIICAVIFMVEVHLMKLVWRSRKLDLIPLFITFVCCVFISLEIGILIGTAVNLAMLLYATARPRIKLFKMEGRLCGSYLLVTPDRSLVFTAMDYFMSTVRKASALHPGVPVVIDMSYVTIADFTTAYGFDNLTEDLLKRSHEVVLTRALPRILTILLGVKPKFHVHEDGTDLEVLLNRIASSPAVTDPAAVVAVPDGGTYKQAPPSPAKTSQKHVEPSC